jgi:nitric oxide reductase NorE protein
MDQRPEMELPDGELPAASGPAAPGPGEKHLPGEEGVWVFILGDLVVFAIFFLTYVVYRSDNTPLYHASQDLLNRPLGLLNTVLLLTSSLFVAHAVRDARNGGRRTPALLIAAICCGVGFCLVKAVEYGEKFAAGITLNSNEFFIFYFMFTGIHLAHVLIGLSVLVYLFARSRRLAPDASPVAGPEASPEASYVQALEGGGAFWHLVDLLWVVLFALLYLMK